MKGMKVMMSLSAPLPGAQSPRVVSALALALLIASRRVQLLLALGGSSSVSELTRMLAACAACGLMQTPGASKRAINPRLTRLRQVA